jgi:hypothetical protein
MGRIQLACFGWPSHFGLVAHHGRTGAARSTNGGAGSSGGALGRLGNTAHPTGGVKKGGVLTGRMSSTAMCGRPEGNSGGGGVRGRWSTARGVGRWYMVARCSWWRWGARRGTEGDATWWLDDGGTWRRSGGDGRVEERLFMGARAPFIASSKVVNPGAKKRRREPWVWQVDGHRGLRWSARSDRRL